MIKYSAIFSAMLVLAGLATLLTVGYLPDRTCKQVSDKELVQVHRSMTFK